MIEIDEIKTITIEILPDEKFRIRLNGTQQDDIVSVPTYVTRNIARALTRAANMFWEAMDNSLQEIIDKENNED